MTVAKEIELSDKIENLGEQLVREVASKQHDNAGDGTTTAIVLAASIAREGAKAVAAGLNPMDLKRGIDLAVDAIVADSEGGGRRRREEGHRGTHCPRPSGDRSNKGHPFWNHRSREAPGRAFGQSSRVVSR